MSKTKKTIGVLDQSFKENLSGATAIEYAVLMAGLALLVLVTMTNFSETASTIRIEIEKALSGPSILATDDEDEPKD